MAGYSLRSRQLLGAVALLAAAFGAGGAAAQSKEVTIAYQQIAGPLITLIQSDAIEKATGYKIDFHALNPHAR